MQAISFKVNRTQVSSIKEHHIARQYALWVCGPAQ